MKKMTSGEILERAASFVAEAEVFETETLAWPVSFKFGQLESAKFVETRGRALRVIQEGRLGFASSGDWSDAEGLLQSGLESVQLGGPAPFHFPAYAPPSAVQCYDPEMEGIEVSHMIEMGKAIIDRLLSAKPDLQVNISLAKATQSVHLANSAGCDFANRRTSFSIGVEVVQAKEGDILILSDTSASRKLQDIETLSLADRILEHLVHAEHIVVPPSRPIPMVLPARGLLLLLLPLQVGLNGRSVFRHTSPLEEKVGLQAFDPRLTLWDDSCRDFALGSAPFDDEGIPTTTKALIEKGVLKGFLYDLKTAGLSGHSPSGNGFRPSYTAPPGIDSGNWKIEPGLEPISKALQEIPEALWVESVIGLGQGNIEQGEFSLNVGLGFLLHHGEIVGRVKNTMIAGNAYQLLRDRLLALDDHTEWVYGSLEAPAVLVDAVNIVTQG
jgi:PmbA protein